MSELFFSGARQETAVHAFDRARMKFPINKREQLTAMNAMIVHEFSLMDWRNKANRKQVSSEHPYPGLRVI